MTPNQSSFIFVSSTNSSGKPSKAQRKQIRSHCMRGKNTRKSEARLIAEGFCADDVPPASSRPPVMSVWRSQRPDEADWVQFIRSSPPLVTFAAELNSESLRLISKIFPGTMRAFSLSEFGIPMDLKSSQFMDWLFSDVAYVHSIITVCSVVQDFLLHRQRSKKTLQHLKKTIINLNGNLSDSKRSLMNETLAVVISLSIAAVISEDHSAMVAHTAGLRELIRLRGGVEGFRGNPQLPVVLARIDLCLSLNTGNPPIFTTTSAIPIPPDLVKSSCAKKYPLKPGLSLDDILGEELAPIFGALQYLAQRVNHAKAPGYGMIESELHAGIWLAQYRLLKLHRTLRDLTAECVRMTMLAFLTTTFRLLGSRVTYKFAAEQLRNLCCAIEISTDQLRRLVFWILMIGLIAFFDCDEPWLREKWQDISPVIEGLEWADARCLLQDYIWMRVCNDEPGKAAFDQMTRKP